MTLLTTFTRRIHTLAGYIENPKLCGLRQRGVNMPLYRKLDQPWLRALRISTILDIGANVGHFAAAAHAVIPRAQIYAFEPLPDVFPELENRLSRIANARAFNIALGNCDGHLTFERNRAHASSSFLKVGTTHTIEFPFSSETFPISVQVERLDDFARSLILSAPIFVKLDVQGFEDRVLQGGEQTIRRASVLLVETSFESLYDGQVLFADIHRVMTQWGFAYRGSLDQLASPRDRRLLQADSIFVRPS